MPYKILLAEDDPRLRDELKILLENALYQVIAPDAFDLIPQAAVTEKADLVLLDINLGDHSGFDICTRIRTQTDIPVIFLTGVTDSGKIKEALVLKPQGYLLKPIDHGKLIESIENVIG